MRSCLDTDIDPRETNTNLTRKRALRKGSKVKVDSTFLKRLLQRYVKSP